MAKSDSFFIRATADFNGTTFTQTSIDLGAYVDALGKSVLRIHNIAVQWGEPLDVPIVGADQERCNAFALTTQSQTSVVDATDKSLIASGKLIGVRGPATTTPYYTQHLDISPQDWRNGYLVGVEQIYLGVDANNADAMSLTQCSIVLECTVETLSQNAAMALALSQQ